MTTIVTDPITQIGADVLREHAKEVPVSDICTPKFQAIIARMREVLENEKEGAALAAPQISEPWRIFVLAPRVFPNEARSASPKYVYINPVIINTSKKKEVLEEGCLSVRGKYGTIRRASQATVHAYDEHGALFTRGASGLMAQAFQHETDHLDGTLFIDHAEDVWDVQDTHKH
jgi:peptide deformylase